MLVLQLLKSIKQMLPAITKQLVSSTGVHTMHLYGTHFRSARKSDADDSIVMKDLSSDTFTLTAKLAPVSMTGFPTFRENELHTLTKSDTFHIDADKVPADIRCSCLAGGRFCLSGTHWLLEYDVDSEYWLDEFGQPKTGALTRYTGKKKGNCSVVIGDGKRICCVEGFMKPVPKKASLASEISYL